MGAVPPTCNKAILAPWFTCLCPRSAHEISQPTTLGGLRHQRAARGTLQGQGYWNDPELVTLEGCQVLERHRDGSWEIATFGYYGRHHRHRFPDESSAVAAIIDPRLTYDDPEGTPSEDHAQGAARAATRHAGRRSVWWRRIVTQVRRG